MLVREGHRLKAVKGPLEGQVLTVTKVAVGYDTIRGGLGGFVKLDNGVILGLNETSNLIAEGYFEKVEDTDE